MVHNNSKSKKGGAWPWSSSPKDPQAEKANCVAACEKKYAPPTTAPSKGVTGFFSGLLGSSPKKEAVPAPAPAQGVAPAPAPGQQGGKRRSKKSKKTRRNKKRSGTRKGSR